MGVGFEMGFVKIEILYFGFGVRAMVWLYIRVSVGLSNSIGVY